MSGPSRSRGFTLIELLVALTVFGLVVGGTLAFFHSQKDAFREGTQRMTVLQNLRFAANALEKDLRTAGSHLVADQPVTVYAGPTTFAFNADFATNDADDPYAVYYEPEATAAEVMALTSARRGPIPGTSFAYPDTTYREGRSPTGALSSAETITFTFSPDGTTDRTDDVVLVRQVNDRAPEVIARRLLPPSSGTFLEYWAIPVDSASSSSSLEQVPPADLPLRHTATIHGSPADTGTAARIDRIHGVRIRLTATNGRTGEEEQRASLDRLVDLPNAGLSRRPSCGDAPLLGVTLSATPALDDGDPVVQLSWGPATDESGGEEDVVRYVLYRRVDGSGSWGDPLLSIPAGPSVYSYTDASVTGGETYDYGLAAQDCTPSLSGITGTTGVTPPVP